jgi:ribonuclease R
VTFAGRIAGLSWHGLFVALIDNGAEGFIPVRSLDNDYYHHDEKAFALIGERTGTIFQMGAGVTVKLKEADGISGSTIFEIVNIHKGAVIEGFSPIIAPRQRPDKRKRSFKKGQERKEQGNKPFSKPTKDRPAKKSGNKPNRL